MPINSLGTRMAHGRPRAIVALQLKFFPLVPSQLTSIQWPTWYPRTVNFLTQIQNDTEGRTPPLYLRIFVLIRIGSCRPHIHLVVSRGGKGIKRALFVLAVKDDGVSYPIGYVISIRNTRNLRTSKRSFGWHTLGHSKNSNSNYSHIIL